MIRLPPGTDARAIGAMPIAPGLATLRLVPDEAARFEADHPGWPSRLAAAPARSSINRQSGIAPPRTERRSRRPANQGGTGKGVVVGVIDTGIDASLR